MPVTGDDIQTYLVSVSKKLESGELPEWTAPEPPTDLGAALTQDEIDFVKLLHNEVLYRFNPPIAP